jgi:hypothetical protein
MQITIEIPDEKGGTEEGWEGILFYIREFFKNFGCKIERLTKLFTESFGDEAFTLCVVYIDHLASGHYGGDQNNHKNFSRALRELGGDPLFAMLHPRELLEKAREYKELGPDAVLLLESAVKAHPSALLEEVSLAEVIRNSSLNEPTKRKLRDNLWRASIASICYSRIRGPLIHGPGSGALSFDESVYMGQKGVKVDFHCLHEALVNIYGQIQAKSIESAEWFGNPNYPDLNMTI